jgi:hypothetical protein
MALKFWLESVPTARPWAAGAAATVMMKDDANPSFSPIVIQTTPILPAELAAKSAAMPGSPLRDIAAAICADKLGVAVTTEPPA